LLLLEFWCWFDFISPAAPGLSKWFFAIIKVIPFGHENAVDYHVSILHRLRHYRVMVHLCDYRLLMGWQNVFFFQKFHLMFVRWVNLKSIPKLLRQFHFILVHYNIWNVLSFLYIFGLWLWAFTVSVLIGSASDSSIM
jgi:hypothetical protein